MIRHYDGTNIEQIVMQSKRGAIWVIVWGHMEGGYKPHGHRICLTAAECEAHRANWVRWQERRGLRPTRHYLFKGMFVYELGQRTRYCRIEKGDPQTRKVLDVR